MTKNYTLFGLLLSTAAFGIYILAALSICLTRAILAIGHYVDPDWPEAYREEARNQRRREE